MKASSLEKLYQQNAPFAELVKLLAEDIALEHMQAPILSTVQAPALKRYHALCETMEVRQIPNLLVISDEAYLAQYKHEGARYIVKDNTIILQEQLWRSFANMQPAGHYAIAHELAHAHEREHKTVGKSETALSRRSFLRGVASTVATSHLTTVTGAVAGMQTSKQLIPESNPYLHNSAVITGGTGGALVAELGRTHLKHHLHGREKSARVRTSELFVDRLVSERLGHEEAIRGLIEFSIGDTKFTRLVGLAMQLNDKEFNAFKAEARALSNTYPIIDEITAETIVLLGMRAKKPELFDKLSSDSMRNGDYPSIHARIMHILQHYNAEKSSDFSR